MDLLAAWTLLLGPLHYKIQKEALKSGKGFHRALFILNNKKSFFVESKIFETYPLWSVERRKIDG